MVTFQYAYSAIQGSTRWSVQTREGKNGWERAILAERETLAAQSSPTLRWESSKQNFEEVKVSRKVGDGFDPDGRGANESPIVRHSDYFS
jgi:hypothetical protein